MIYPNFIEDSEFLSMNTEATKVEQISALAKNLNIVHSLTTDSYKDFDELILKYLKAGLKVFNMKIGIVSKIEDNNYTVCNALSPEGSLNKGDEFSLEGTYCREVFKSKQVIGLPHVGNLTAFKDHPVYINMKLESYISAPIYVNNEIFGTLNFSSTEKRKYGFSESEKSFISLMARSIGNFIAIDLKEKELIKSNNRLKKIVGFVAHDLRNPLGSIISFADLLEVEGKENKEILGYIEQTANHGMEIVKTILEMAAIGTGKVELNFSNFNLSLVLNNSNKKYLNLYKKKNIKLDIDCDEDLICYGDSLRLEQVFTNLFSNFAKYVPENSTASVKAVLVEGKIDISFSNERDCLSDSGFKINTYDELSSTGFGHDIIREILKLHNSKAIINSTDKMFIFSFRLYTEK